MAWQRLNITFDRHQMPAGTGRKGIEREWAEPFLPFIAEPTQKIFGIRRHTGPDSCRYMWTYSHTNSRK